MDQLPACGTDDLAAVRCHFQLIGSVQQYFGLIGILRGKTGDIFHPDGNGTGDQGGDDCHQIGHQISGVIYQQCKSWFNK